LIGCSAFKRRRRIGASPTYFSSYPTISRRNTRINTGKNRISATHAPADHADLDVLVCITAFQNERTAAVALARIATRSLSAEHVGSDRPCVARVIPPYEALGGSAVLIGDGLELYFLECIAQLRRARTGNRIAPAHRSDTVSRFGHSAVGIETHQLDISAGFARKKDQVEVVVGVARPVGGMGHFGFHGNGLSFVPAAPLMPTNHDIEISARTVRSG